MHAISRRQSPNPQRAGRARHGLAQYPHTTSVRIGHALPALAKGRQLQRLRWKRPRRRQPAAAHVPFDPGTMPLHEIPNLPRSSPRRHDYFDYAIAEYPH